VLFRLQAISSSHTFNRAHTHTHARAHTHRPEIGLAIGHLLGWWMQGRCTLGFWDWARRNSMQKFYESQEAQLPISVSDPVLEDNMKWHWWAKAKFLANKRYQMSKFSNQLISCMNAQLIRQMKPYRRKFFNHNRPVAFLIKQFVCTPSVLFPGLQGFHLVNTDGRSSKLFEIQLSVLKSAHLVPWQPQVSALYDYITQPYYNGRQCVGGLLC